MPTPKRTTPEQQRARKAKNARAYRKRHAERARAARRKADAKRRAKNRGKQALKGELRPAREKPRPSTPIVGIKKPKAKKTPAKPAPSNGLDPATGWAAWTATP